MFRSLRFLRFAIVALNLSCEMLRGQCDDVFQGMSDLSTAWACEWERQKLFADRLPADRGEHVGERSVPFGCVPWATERVIMAMTLLSEPQRDKTEKQHGDWRRPLNGGASLALWLLEAQGLLAIAKGDLRSAPIYCRS